MSVYSIKVIIINYVPAVVAATLLRTAATNMGIVSLMALAAVPSSPASSTLFDTLTSLDIAGAIALAIIASSSLDCLNVFFATSTPH